MNKNEQMARLIAGGDFTVRIVRRAAAELRSEGWGDIEGYALKIAEELGTFARFANNFTVYQADPDEWEDAEEALLDLGAAVFEALAWLHLHERENDSESEGGFCE